jgi:hypothetical protein
VDAGIAPLVVQMHDCTPWFACEDLRHSGDVEFIFEVRSLAMDFLAELADFGRSGGFNVAYNRDEISIVFPIEWVDGLTERYRRFWERRAE